jgi:hypothetical protein
MIWGDENPSGNKNLLLQVVCPIHFRLASVPHKDKWLVSTLQNYLQLKHLRLAIWGSMLNQSGAAMCAVS